MNKFLVIGNLTHDPELAQKGDTSYCKFSVAVNRPAAGAEGERKTDFFDFTAFRGLAETVARYCKKGNKVCVEARVETNNYEDAQGNKRYGYNFVASEVEFLTPKAKDEQESAAE